MIQPTAEQFTEQAWAAIVSAQEIAQAKKQQKLETEHLFLALLQHSQGLTTRILEKASVDTSKLTMEVEEFIQRQASLSSAQENIFIGKGMQTLLDRSEGIKKELEDSFISIEHLILALGIDERCGKQLLQAANLNENKLRAAIKAIRGSQRVTHQNPEGTYESLEKYGRDLTAAARKGKLDPVIG